MEPHAAARIAEGEPGPSREALDEAIREAGHWAARADEARQRLEALDAATIAINHELSLERVLQLIVDSVRPLAAARYAALGIPDDKGSLERFITSGIGDQARRSIGHQPRGLGLLGEVIRGGRSLRVPDLAADQRSAGFPPGHPAMTSFLGVPVHIEGRAIGNLYLADKEGPGGFSEEDERLVESFARHAGLAIHNARMREGLRQMTILEERERIAQDLHDGSIQSLYAVGLSLEDTEELMRTDPAQAAERIDHAIESIHAIIGGIREFIMGLDADARAAVDLLAGLSELTAEFEQRTLINVDLAIDPKAALSPDETQQLVQLTREALSNVARHAEATNVVVRVEDRRDHLRLTINDDGHGFDTGEKRSSGHHGLANMRARAESLGGRLSVASDHHGTEVVVETRPGERADHGELSPEKESNP
ncbi:MAG: GAF domain-containing sensor histidine kinase [Chloroflexota bacterium]